ncbi:hypothetical protein CBX98_25515, partial [Vibrio sp. T9]
LVEGDEFHAGQVADQAPLQLADDPGEPRPRRLFLQCADQRRYMRHIADGGCAHDAEAGISRREGAAC